MINKSITTIKPALEAPLSRLNGLPQPIEKLHCMGDSLVEQLQNPTVAIVGSRKVSPYGRSVTHDFARFLAQQGIVIVSGLALGVDSIAHKGCIEGTGKTIAVLPSSLESIYPASHRGLASQIVKTGGTLVTEYSGQGMPMKHYFIARNRIIAALADIILVTEAAERSGSLYTAEFGLELGKTVYAVPGPIDSPTSKGTNILIKMGATPALRPEDILDEFGISTTNPGADQGYIPENEAEKTLLDLMRSGITDGHEILDKSDLTAVIFQQQMTLLEIKGVIAPGGNNTWRER